MLQKKNLIIFTKGLTGEALGWYDDEEEVKKGQVIGVVGEQKNERN